MRRLFLIILFCIFAWSGLHAEYLYLKDGQVIQGTIESEDANGYNVKTKYQTKWVPRGDVVRIMFGERKMEPIFLLMNDGTTKKGFLVDQDAEKIIIRDKEDSPKEITILKKDVKQMSGSEIVKLSPSITVKAGYFFPLNSGNAELKAAPFVMAGSDMTFVYMKNIRVMAEAGYAKCEGEYKDFYMMFVPLLASASYNIGFNRFYIAPGITAGTTLIDYNNGETGKSREFALTAGCRLGLIYEIVDNSLYLSLNSDYMYMADKGGNLHTAAATAGISYRF